MNNNQITLLENLLEKNGELVNEIASAFGDLAEEMKKLALNLWELLCPFVNELLNYMWYVYPNGRVKHLALYSKSVRIRKKNLRRILKSYQKYLKKEAEE